MGMWSYICKGCGQEIVEGELCRFNGGIGRYDGYGRCGNFNGEDRENPVAWHEWCFQHSTGSRGDKLPSPNAPNQGFGPRHLQFMEHYNADAPTTYTFHIETWDDTSDRIRGHLWFLVGDKLEDQELWDEQRRDALDQDFCFDKSGNLLPNHEEIMEEFDKKWDSRNAPEHRCNQYTTLEVAKNIALVTARQFNEYNLVVYGEQEKANGMVYQYKRHKDIKWQGAEYTDLGTYTEGMTYDINVKSKFMPNKKALMKEALEIRNRLFDIANAFAGEETGGVAVGLHGACNEISYAFKVFDPEAFAKAQKGEPHEYQEKE